MNKQKISEARLFWASRRALPGLFLGSPIASWALSVLFLSSPWARPGLSLGSSWALPGLSLASLGSFCVPVAVQTIVFFLRRRAPPTTKIVRGAPRKLCVNKLKTKY